MDKVKALEELRDGLRENYSRFDKERVEIGDFTYGMPMIMSWGEKNAMLKIGKFCSIGSNVRIYLGGNHRTDWCTTYPFNVLLNKIYPGIDGEVAATKGNVTIGNDVWIADNVTILSGVYIGDGAVIANGAVVVKDVRPYDIVGGVPAKHLKWRMTGDYVRKLAWWDWPLEKLAEAVPLLNNWNPLELEKFDKEWSNG